MTWDRPGFNSERLPGWSAGSADPFTLWPDLGLPADNLGYFLNIKGVLVLVLPVVLVTVRFLHCSHLCLSYTEDLSHMTVTIHSFLKVSLFCKLAWKRR